MQEKALAKGLSSCNSKQNSWLSLSIGVGDYWEFVDLVE